MLKLDTPWTRGQYPRWGEMDDDNGNNANKNVKLKSKVK